MHKLAALLAVALLTPAALAEDRASTQDAERLVHKAVDFLKAEGREKAFAEFSNPKGRFTYRDLYIFAKDFHGVTLAHGSHPELIGKNDIDRKDSTGKLFIKEMIEVARSKGSGWIQYNWGNPVTGKDELKVTYVETVDDVVVGCGAFKP